MAYRILVVDDEPTLVRLMQFILAKQGHTMMVATNGEDGLETAKREKPDLILLDIMMPRMDGYEVARCIRADSEISSTSIIMLSAKAQDDDVKKGMEVGVDEYITKPFSPERLVRVVNDYLERLELKKAA
jgi:DNA-binding response OmpR family regulator